MVKIATWNVNSIKARLPILLAWLEGSAPDIVLLQELKCVEENFPRLEIEALGYHTAMVGQKSYNGVAVLSKSPIEDRLDRLPGDAADEQARYLEVSTFGLRVATIYLPNGNPPDTEKYPYKLAWMERLHRHALNLLARDQAVVLGGDYNVIPNDEDCYDPRAWRGDALFKLETRKAFRSLVNLGLTDALETCGEGGGHYTFWDYQGGAWQADHGIRIDHILLSPQAADRLESCTVDRGPRGKQKASDHTPVVCELTA